MLQINLPSLVSAMCAVLFAGLISFALTPAVRVFAFRIGAIDIPHDERRMHKKPMPRIGGVAIFLGFTISSLIFCEATPALITIWAGGLVLVVMGVLDDVFNLPALVKLAFQIAVAVLAVSQDVMIEQINLFGRYIRFGVLSAPITILWIVALTNAINLIDGLDGLACGVSAICSLSMLGVVLVTGDLASALVTAVLAASCFGFLPFNSNPAKIFMGDCGALFLGYTMAVLSVQGLFKLHAIIAFVIPVSIFALPLFDTAFAFLRRLVRGKNPFKGDRGHIHHRLMGLGLTQKQSVHILYSVCGIMGLAAVVFSDAMWNGGAGSSRVIKCVAILLTAFVVLAVNFVILRDKHKRLHTGLLDDAEAAALEEEIKAEDAAKDDNKSDPAEFHEQKS